MDSEETRYLARILSRYRVFGGEEYILSRIAQRCGDVNVCTRCLCIHEGECEVERREEYVFENYFG